MAPAIASARGQRGRKQPDVRSFFGKVTKPVAASQGKKIALKEGDTRVEIKLQAAAPLRRITKRKHTELDKDDLCEQQAHSENVTEAKKPKLQLESRPFIPESNRKSGDASSVSRQSSATSVEPAPNAPEPIAYTTPVTLETLPETLRDILSLHDCFLKALSIHYAHNAAGSPAPLHSLTKSITSLWKKHSVGQAEIQRMLALYEYSSEHVPVFDSERKVLHRQGPFKLNGSGVGNAKTVSVEYVGQVDDTTGARNITHLIELVLASHNVSNAHLGFLSKSLPVFPLLACALGTQSANRQQKALERRTEILTLSTAAQKRQNKTTRHPINEANRLGEEDKPVAAAIKSRTQSLFDRVAAKAAVTASSSTPTAADIVRRHAIGRIEEVVGILRMKQQQRSRASSSYSPVKSRAAGKVSFSIGQLQRDIADSVAIPISQEEMKVCLKILAEVQQSWVKILESGIGERKTDFIVLEGDGMTGHDVGKMLEDMELKKRK